MAKKAATSPNSYEAQFNYALEAHKLKDYNNALLYYKKAQNLDPSKEETYLKFYIDSNGSIEPEAMGDGPHDVYPVLYLEHDVTIKQGTGSKANPYVLN